MTRSPTPSSAALASFARGVWERPWLAVSVIFALAVWQRATMPWLPLADPDTWGYLNPAFQHLAGEGMVQTHCRSIAYPLFLRLVFGISGDFQSIALAQHILGLLSGVVWLAAFRGWIAWLPGEMSRSIGARWFAAFCLGAYLCNPATLAFESQIRPEAVFPLFALGQIAATLAFIRTRWSGGPAAWHVGFAAISVLLGAVCLGLKPSWGIAAVVPFVAVAAGVVARHPAASLAQRSCIVMAVVAMLSVWNFGVPWIARWIPEKDAGRHLAGTLFTIHADIISRNMHRKAESGTLDAEERRFLDKLDARISDSRKFPKSPYAMLGHDADYLFFQSDLLVEVPHVPADDGGRRIQYLQREYLDAVIGEPLAMIQKILRQFVAAYGDASQSLFSRTVQWKALFKRTNAAFDVDGLPEFSGGFGDSIRRSLTCTAAAVESQPEMLEMPQAPPRWFLRGVVTWVLAGVVALGGLAICAYPWLARKEMLRPWRAAFWTFATIWACSTGSALTVAVIHCFAIDRYMMLQSATNSLLLATGLTLAWSVLRRSLGR